MKAEKQAPPAQAPGDPAVLFDLDGTLLDTVYQHVSAWSASLRSEGIVLPNWKINRRVGMSGNPWSGSCFAN